MVVSQALTCKDNHRIITIWACSSVGQSRRLMKSCTRKGNRLCEWCQIRRNLSGDIWQRRAKPEREGVET